MNFTCQKLCFFSILDPKNQGRWASHATVTCKLCLMGFAYKKLSYFCSLPLLWFQVAGCADFILWGGGGLTSSLQKQTTCRTRCRLSLCLCESLKPPDQSPPPSSKMPGVGTLRRGCYDDTSAVAICMVRSVSGSLQYRDDDPNPMGTTLRACLVSTHQPQSNLVIHCGSAPTCIVSKATAEKFDGGDGAAWVMCPPHPG